MEGKTEMRDPAHILELAAWIAAVVTAVVEVVRYILKE